MQHPNTKGRANMAAHSSLLASNSRSTKITLSKHGERAAIHPPCSANGKRNRQHAGRGGSATASTARAASSSRSPSCSRVLERLISAFTKQGQEGYQEERGRHERRDGEVEAEEDGPGGLGGARQAEEQPDALLN